MDSRHKTPTMKVLSLLTLAALIPLSAEASSICDSDPSNIVQNCGFETGNTSSWTQTGNWSAGWSKIGVDPHGLGVNSGSYAFFFGNYPYQGESGVSQTLTDTLGTTYQLSFSVVQDETNTGGNQSFSASVNGTPLLLLVDQQVSVNWTSYIFNFVGTGTDTIAFSGYENSGYNGLDDVNVHAVSAVPLPTSVWLFVSAIAGFIGFNRRKTIQQ